jgi:hypothetical protein
MTDRDKLPAKATTRYVVLPTEQSGSLVTRGLEALKAAHQGNARAMTPGSPAPSETPAPSPPHPSLDPEEAMFRHEAAMFQRRRNELAKATELENPVPNSPAPSAIPAASPPHPSLDPEEAIFRHASAALKRVAAEWQAKLAKAKELENPVPNSPAPSATPVANPPHPSLDPEEAVHRHFHAAVMELVAERKAKLAKATELENPVPNSLAPSEAPVPARLPWSQTNPDEAVVRHSGAMMKRLAAERFESSRPSPAAKVPFQPPSDVPQSGQEPMATQEPQSEASLRKSGDWPRVAISLASQMALSGAQRMLAMKTRQALSGAERTDAITQYRKAAEQGDAEAQYNLGEAYYEGDGGSQDYAQAVMWWLKAAEQGWAAAQYQLGCAYSAGEGVPKDYVKAHMWFSLESECAYAGGSRTFFSPSSYEQSKDIEKYMTLAQIAEAQRLAREWTESHAS